MGAYVLRLGASLFSLISCKMLIALLVWPDMDVSRIAFEKAVSSYFTCRTVMSCKISNDAVLRNSMEVSSQHKNNSEL